MVTIEGDMMKENRVVSQPDYAWRGRVRRECRYCRLLNRRSRSGRVDGDDERWRGNFWAF